MLLDTNVLSETMRPEPAWQVLALLGVALLPAGKRRDALELKVAALFTQHFANRCLPFDAQAAPHYARIVAYRRNAGKRIATEDAQIAAIACSRRYSLATRNVSDFGGIAGLEIVNPWDAA